MLANIKSRTLSLGRVPANVLNDLARMGYGSHLPGWDLMETAGLGS